MRAGAVSKSCLLDESMACRIEGAQGLLVDESIREAESWLALLELAPGRREGEHFN